MNLNKFKNRLLIFLRYTRNISLNRRLLSK
jgi:hypothetical protein